MASNLAQLMHYRTQKDDIEYGLIDGSALDPYDGIEDGMIGIFNTETEGLIEVEVREEEDEEGCGEGHDRNSCAS